MMFASERAVRYNRYMNELHPDMKGLQHKLSTGCYERRPSDDIEYPMDKILDGLMAMHRAGLRRNPRRETGPGDAVAATLDRMLQMVQYARAIDTSSPEGAYDGLMSMEDALVERKRREVRS